VAVFPVSAEEHAQEQPDGEIGSLADSPLQTRNLDEYAEVAAPTVDSDYGDLADERAIARLLRQLRSQPSSQSLSEERLTEKAESLYALLCRQIVDGATGDTLVKVAELFGEQPEKLRDRLR
jgi:hypothetical protein